MNIYTKKKFIKNTVKDAIQTLFNHAEKSADQHPNRARRYMQMLWALVKKYKIQLTKEHKKKFCRKCLSFFIIDKNVKIIFDMKHDSFYLKCENCNFKRKI